LKSPIKAATLDIGGVIYSDDAFKRAIYDSLKVLSPRVPLDEFNKIYRDHLESQSSSLRGKLCERFLGSREHLARLIEMTDARWIFTDLDLYQDVLPLLDFLQSHGLRLGIVANQPRSVVESLKKHGLLDYFEFLGISSLVGLEKPSPKLYQLAMDSLGVSAGEIIHIGNRLDNDVLAAAKVGFLTAWIIRGESKAQPSEEERALADFTANNLSDFHSQFSDYLIGGK